MFSQQNGFSPPTEPVTGSFIAVYNKDRAMEISTVLVNSSGANVIYLSRADNSSNLSQYSYIIQNTSNSRIMLQRDIGNSTEENTQECGAIDNDGNIFTAGQYVTSSANPGFLAKYGNTGNLLWQREYYRVHLGSPINGSFWRGCDVENGGANVYVAGYTSYVVSNVVTSFGSVVKYNTNGNILARYKSSNEYASIQDLVVDNSNNYYITGRVVVANVSDDHGSVEKFYANGTQIWANALRISNVATVFIALAVDSANNVIAVDNGTNIAKFYANGSVNWVTQGVDVSFTDVVVDSSDNIYVSGQKGNGFPLVGYYAKFYSNGTPIFQNTIDYTENPNATVTINTTSINHTGSNIYLGGYISANANVGYEGLSAKLPDDGSATGTYAFFNIASNTTTYSTPSYVTDPSGFGLGTVSNTTNSAATATSSNGNIKMRIVPL